MAECFKRVPSAIDDDRALKRPGPPELQLAAIGGAILLAPVASAATPSAPGLSAAAVSAPTDTDPLVPYGTDPHTPVLGYHVLNHDEANTTNGQVDVPF
jgi:hypothetical protein